MEKQNQNILSREGLRKLKDELKHLIEVDRPTVIKEIKEAREQGDLSENAEFDAAREKQGKTEDRISEIERIVAESTVVIDKKNSTKKIRIGSKVRVLIKGKEQDFTIVGSLEANPFDGKISNVSPMGEGLLNAEIGDTIKVRIEDATKSKVIKVEILKFVK